MNLLLLDRRQPVLAFGGAASMVHPASGYMVGSLLRRGPGLAQALAAALNNQNLGSAALAQRGWQALWPVELVLRHQLHQFGLGRLMGFNEALLRTHFVTFFSLPQEEWFGFLTNTLPLPRLMAVMRGSSRCRPGSCGADWYSVHPPLSDRPGPSPAAESGETGDRPAAPPQTSCPAGVHPFRWPATASRTDPGVV